jgi:hypothetical protein
MVNFLAFWAIGILVLSAAAALAYGCARLLRALYLRIRRRDD